MQRSVKWISNQNVPEIKNSPLLLTVCDENYFHFAESLINSLTVFSPENFLCVHVINPSGKLIKKIKEQLAKNPKFIASYEITNIDFLNDEQKKTYYALARFFRITELLKTFNTDILCLDSDSLIVNKIDYDFTNKEEADICLIRRDISDSDTKNSQTETPVHMKVATGSIYSRNRPATLRFYNDLVVTLKDRIKNSQMHWFTDQIIFYETIVKMEGRVTVRSIKTKYADWTFKSSSIVWAGKGDAKNTNFKFTALQKLLSSNEFTRQEYLTLAYKFSGRDGINQSDIAPKITTISKDFRKKVVIFLPRLDLPWKKPAIDHPAPLLSEQATELRVLWKKFCMYLSNALEREGFLVETIEIPAWEITEKVINYSNCSLAFIPHRCKLDFNTAQVSIPIYFYMQEFFSWLFVVDQKGWSAASTIYPVNYAELTKSDHDKYSIYLQKLSDNTLGSKFFQPERTNINALLDTGQLPRHPDPRISYKKFIFFPLQIPHDQSIKYFSDVIEEDVIYRLLDWSEKNDIPIVFKPHPANIKSMEPLLEIIREKNGYIADANIHELIELSSAVYTINSGVGFEALFHNKPIVTFGRVEYDCCTFKANFDNLDFAWIYCLLSNQNDLRKGYAKFFNWFVTEYAYDLSDYDMSAMKLRFLVKRIKKRHFPHIEAVK